MARAVGAGGGDTNPSRLFLSRVRRLVWSESFSEFGLLDSLFSFRLLLFVFTSSALVPYPPPEHPPPPLSMQFQVWPNHNRHISLLRD